MVTLSSCLIWQIIRFILPPNEYGCVYAWTTLGNIATLLLPFMVKKKIIFSNGAHFDIGGYVHTYIHNWPLQPFSQDYWPSFSHHLCCVCQFFIHKCLDLQFKVDSKRQIFWETFHSNFIYSQSFSQKSAERKSPKKYFSYFVLMSGLGLEPWLFV